jgi:hypothetical protein
MKGPYKSSADWGVSTTPIGSRWSPEEAAITIYFTSRQIHPRTLRFLLLRQGYDRSTQAIERKVFTTIQEHPHLKTRGRWNLDVVDRWIDDLLGDHESVNTLILFSPEDAEDVACVRCTLKLILPYTHRVPVESTY